MESVVSRIFYENTVMGEINLPVSGKGNDKPKAKKLSTRVDLTPMVDLGFLLITFFIFTTTMSEPTALKLKMPHDSVLDPNKTPETKTLNLIISGNNKILHYTGLDINSIKEVADKDEAIRNVIIAKKQELAKRFGKGEHLVVLIKPTYEARYESIVNVIDEMTINDVRRYVFMDPTAEEVKSAEQLAATF